MNIPEIAMATVATLAPFTPFLIEIGKASGEKFAEVIAEKGGESAWKKAQGLWDKVTKRFKNDREIESAVTMVAVKPEDETRQKILTEVLIARLQETPDFANELFNLLGGQEAIQQVLADRSSWVEDVTQTMKRNGKQTVEASADSIIKGVKQMME